MKLEAKQRLQSTLSFAQGQQYQQLVKKEREAFHNWKSNPHPTDAEGWKNEWDEAKQAVADFLSKYNR